MEEIRKNTITTSEHVKSKRKTIILDNLNAAEIASFQQRRITIFRKKSHHDYDKEVESLVNNFNTRRNNLTFSTVKSFWGQQNIISEMNLNEIQYLHSVLYLMNKRNKSASETIYVGGYLLRLRNFVESLSKAGGNLEDVINKIAYQIYNEFIHNGEILFKYGEKGDRFYVILKGKLGVLLPSEKQLKMNEIDYIRYLAKLHKHKEEELLNKVISLNKNTFPIAEDNLELYLKETVKNTKLNNFKRSLTKEFAESALKLMTYDDKNFKLSIEEYINRIQAEIEYNELYTELQNVYIFEYKLVTYLDSGDNFGEVALDKKNQKRIATIIAVEDSYLGVIDRDLYQSSVKDAINRLKRTNILFLINCQLFKNCCNYENFERQYFNMFANKKINRGMKLIKAGQSALSIYFIKSGEFEVTMKKNIPEINNILNSLGIKVDDRDEKHLISSDLECKKIYYEKTTIRLSIIVDKEIIGLNDMIYENSFYCDVICVSHMGESFELGKDSLEMILYKEDEANYNLNEISKVKYKIMSEKMLKYKNSKLKRYYDDFNSKLNRRHKLLRNSLDSSFKFPKSVQVINNNLSPTKKDESLPKVRYSSVSTVKKKEVVEKKNNINPQDSNIDWFEKLLGYGILNTDQTDKSIEEKAKKSRNIHKKNKSTETQFNTEYSANRFRLKSFSSFKDAISLTLSSPIKKKDKNEPNLINFMDPINIECTEPNKKNKTNLMEEIGKLRTLKAKHVFSDETKELAITHTRFKKINPKYTITHSKF